MVREHGNTDLGTVDRHRVSNGVSALRRSRDKARSALTAAAGRVSVLSRRPQAGGP